MRRAELRSTAGVRASHGGSDVKSHMSEVRCAGSCVSRLVVGKV